MRKQIFKAEAEGDTVYLEAENSTEAYNVLVSKLGPIPRSMVTFTEVNALPDDEQLL
jgi:hypothetical protein